MSRSFVDFGRLRVFQDDGIDWFVILMNPAGSALILSDGPDGQPSELHPDEVAETAAERLAPVAEEVPIDSLPREERWDEFLKRTEATLEDARREHR